MERAAVCHLRVYICLFVFALTRNLLEAIRPSRNSHGHLRFTDNEYIPGLLTKLRSRWLYIDQFYFFFLSHVYDQDGVLVHKLAKKNQANIQPYHLDRKRLVQKGFIIWLSRKLFLRDAAGKPERAR